MDGDCLPVFLELLEGHGLMAAEVDAVEGERDGLRAACLVGGERDRGGHVLAVVLNRFAGLLVHERARKGVLLAGSEALVATSSLMVTESSAIAS